MEQVLSEEGLRRARERYQRADGRKKKSALLTEFCELTGCHRKHATRVLGRQRSGRPPNPSRRGPKSRYHTAEFLSVLRVLYRVTDRMCAVLLKGAIPEWLPWVERRYGAVSPETRELLASISPQTIDRVLREHKLKFPKAQTGTKPGTLKRTEIPIRQGIWEESRPGFMEADTVAHCGETMAGMFVWTLTMTDIATQWTECRAVWHKGAKGIVDAVRDVESRLPFELLGFDCDNGGEFINHHLIQYLTVDHPQKRVIQFTRSREYRKNDNAHVEQRNWSHTRQLFYRERLDFYELTDVMNDLLSNEFSQLRNHFYPTMKLDHRVQIRSRYRRIYGQAATPYQRVMESAFVGEEQKEKLRRIHETLNPLELKERLDAKLKLFWRLLRELNRQRAANLAA